jgi:nuclear transcription Y subunit beta
VTGIASKIASITRACFTIGQSLSPERKRWTSGRATAVTRPIMSHTSLSPSPKTTARASESKKDNDSDANIRNFAPVARIMKTALPENAKIAKEAKECMQECVSEFISFITSEGMYQSDLEQNVGNADCPITASEKCHQEKRKTVNGEDILFAMTSLGFENYAEALKIYLSKYREVSSLCYDFDLRQITK